MSIYGFDALEVSVAFTEVEGTEPGRSLEVPVVLAEVEGTEPGGSLKVPVVLAEVKGMELGGAPIAVAMSGGACRGSIWSSSRKCNS